MATTKDITMKQFNGTDYDTLYPKTDVEQVGNLTPSSIGAVAKTGDTMTGNLVVPTLSVAQNVSAGYIYGETNSLNIKGGNPNTGAVHYLKIKDSGVYVDNNLVCHNGNLLSMGKSMGIAQIATGSYVGTGYSGQSHPMSINIGFTPKLFWICLKLDNRDGEPVAVMIPGGSASDSNGLFIYPFTKYFCGDSTRDYYVTVTWGSTMSWYGYVDFDDTEHGKYQFNEVGVTYYWVAIG